MCASHERRDIFRWPDAAYRVDIAAHFLIFTTQCKPPCNRFPLAEGLARMCAGETGRIYPAPPTEQENARTNVATHAREIAAAHPSDVGLGRGRSLGNRQRYEHRRGE